MVRLCTAILIAASVSILSPAALASGQEVPDPQRQSIEQAIRAVQAQMMEAAGRLDAVALYGHVLDTDTPPIIEDGRLMPTHAAAFANTATGLQGLARVSYAYTREHITVISPAAALWVGEGMASATLEDGRQIAAPFAETLLFVQREGQWKILHAHRSTPDQR